MSSYVLDLLVIWLCTYLKRTEFTPVYGECEWSIGGPEEGTCPKYDTRHWTCFALEKNCSAGTDYHCAKDLMTGSWKEMCDEMKLCHAGEEPQIIDNKVRCGYCQDVEKYNPASNTPSHKFSDCPRRKTKCIPEQNGMVECDEAYDRMDTNSRYKMDRRCRCYYEKNYMPSFYNVERDTWTCIVAFQLDCVQRPCPETEDGRTQRRHEDYRCYPEQDVMSTTDVSVKLWSALETKPHTMTQKTDIMTTKKPLKLTPGTTLEKTNDKSIQEPDSLRKEIIISVVIVSIVLISGVIIVCIVRIMKGKENGQSQIIKKISKNETYIKGDMINAETALIKNRNSSDAEDYHNKPMYRPPNDGSPIEEEPLNPNADGVSENTPVADSYSDTSDVNDNSDDKKNSVSNFPEIKEHNNDPGSVNVPIEYDKKQPGPGHDQDSDPNGSNFKPLNSAQQDKKITDKDDQVHFIGESIPSIDVIYFRQPDATKNKDNQDTSPYGSNSGTDATDSDKSSRHTEHLLSDGKEKNHHDYNSEFLSPADGTHEEICRKNFRNELMEQEQENEAKEFLLKLETKPWQEVENDIKNLDVKPFEIPDSPARIITSPVYREGEISLPSDFEAHASAADGNCLFNSVSLLLYGDERATHRLRLAAVCNGISKTELYIKKLMVLHTDPENLMEYMQFSLTDTSIQQLDQSRLKDMEYLAKFTIKRAVLETIKPGSYSGPIQVWFLSSAIDYTIRQYFQAGVPNPLSSQSPEEFSDVYPLSNSEHIASGRFVIILWVSMNSKCLNHIIPVIQKTNR